VLRYLGFALIILIALGLAAGVGVVLLRGMPDRQAIRLTVFDGVAAVGGPAPRLRAMLEDADAGKPVCFATLIVRSPEGWTGRTWSSSNGVCLSAGPSGLSAGPHDFAVGVPELTARLDAYSHGTVWVRPAETEMVWLDAAAIVPTGGAEVALAAAPSPAPDVVDAVKMLASGRQAVYLVAADAAEYASVRQRLAERRVPLGPAFWVKPGVELSRLQGLKQVWPRVAAGVVCTAALAKAAETLGVHMWFVPIAGGPELRPAVMGAWREAVEQLTVPRGAAVKEK
jgi:hypothetical protein